MFDLPSPRLSEASASSDPVQHLTRSYGSLLDQQPWDVDGGETGMVDVENPMQAAPPAAPPSPLRIIEALCFVGGAPLTAHRAGEIVRGLTTAQFADAIESLNRDYRKQGRPYHIQPQGSGYVLSLRPRFQSVVEKLYGGMREARLSSQAVDVLALVAYRQPATKQEVDSLRGADSGNLLRQLVRRGLIAVVQRAEADQKQVSYGTTQRFLDLFQLTSLDDLPQTQDLQKL